jgi:hypothetical protein
VVLAGILGTPAARAGDDAAKDGEARLKIQVEGEDGSSVRLDIGAGWLAGLIESVDVECESEAEGDERAMMLSMRCLGVGGVYRYREDDEGDDVVARRSRGALKIESTDRDGERSTVEMPWEVAECLMMGVDPPGDLGRRIARGEARMRLDLRDGDGRVRISLD